MSERSTRSPPSAGRVLVSGSNTSPVLTSDLAGNEGPEHHPGYFRTAHNDAIQGAAAAKFVFEELGLTNVATVNDGDPYTQGLTSAFEFSFEELGGTIAISTAVTADQTDMRPVLTEIAAAGAELIFFPIFQPAGDFLPIGRLDVQLGAENAGQVVPDQQVAVAGAGEEIGEDNISQPVAVDRLFEIGAAEAQADLSPRPDRAPQPPVGGRCS